MKQPNLIIDKLLNEGKYTLAIKKLKSFAKKAPKNAELERLTGVTYIHLKQFRLAEKHLKLSISYNPELPTTQLNIASLYKEQANYPLAISTLQNLLKNNPQHVAAHFNLGNVYRLTENWQQAKQHYETVLKLNPNHLPVLVTLGLLCKNSGEIKASINYFHRALDIDPFNKSVYLALTNLKNYTFSDNEISMVSKIIDQSSDADSIELLFAKAQYLEHQEKYTEAFDYLERANQAQYKKLNRKATDWAQYTDQVKAVFDQVAVSSVKPANINPEPNPLFIVSMPRSGSTLVEQILASHPDIYGAAELTTFPHSIKQLELDKKARYPEAWIQTDDKDLAQMASEYSAKISSYGSEFSYVTDKSLLNFNYIGAILDCLPNSRFIHCTRHPMDVCLSCYKQLFSAGQEYSYDIQELAAYYKHHERIMAYWKKRYSEQILTVNYESLIADTENNVKTILGFLNLPWNDNCLQFHKTKRVIKTASAAQVTQKIYTNASHRYLKYGNSLEKLKISLNIP